MKKVILLLLCTLMIISLISCGDFMEIVVSGMQSASDFENVEKEALNSGESHDSLHRHEYTTEQILPICEENGYMRHICDCGYYYHDEFTDEVGEHQYERGVCVNCNDIDYNELVNIISTETMKANVGVTVSYYKAVGFSPVLIGNSNGSGVIFKEQNGTYYLLTNNHVVYNDDLTNSARYITYSVTDYLGNEYEAELIERKPEYDLAIVSFTPKLSEEEYGYTIASLTKKNAEAGDFVISIGEPEGQANTITLGNVIEYKTVNMDSSAENESSVNFEVLKHDAYISDGSSGGALLNASLEIIGINFAGSRNQETQEFVYAYAIPIEQVYSFLEEIGFEY